MKPPGDINPPRRSTHLKWFCGSMLSLLLLGIGVYFIVDFSKGSTGPLPTFVAMILVGFAMGFVIVLFDLEGLLARILARFRASREVNHD